MADVEKRAVDDGPEIVAATEGETYDLPVKDLGADHTDIAFDLFQQSHQYDPAQLEIDAVKVRRKLDFIVLPMVPFLSPPLRTHLTAPR